MSHDCLSSSIRTRHNHCFEYSAAIVRYLCFHASGCQAICYESIGVGSLTCTMSLLCWDRHWWDCTNVDLKDPWKSRSLTAFKGQNLWICSLAPWPWTLSVLSISGLSDWSACWFCLSYLFAHPWSIADWAVSLACFIFCNPLLACFLTCLPIRDPLLTGLGCLSCLFDPLQSIVG